MSIENKTSQPQVASGNEDSSSSPTSNSGEGSEFNSKEFLFKQGRESKRENQELRARIEELERRITPLETFFGKAKQLFDGMFRNRGVNIDEENQQGGAKNVTEEQYTQNRPGLTAEAYNRYKERLQNSGLSQEEIANRLAKIQEDQPGSSEPAVNRNMESTQGEEISWDEYTSQRPTLQQHQKEMISEAGGVTPELAQQSAQLRERLQSTAQPQTGEEIREAQRRKVNPEEKSQFQQQQANIQPGVNQAAENQIDKEDLTVGQAIDQKFGATSEGLRSMASLMEQQDNPEENTNSVGANDLNNNTTQF